MRDQYFEWLYDLVCDGRYSKENSYRKLLMHLHNTEFVYFIPKDENRAMDGIDLREVFAGEQDADLYLGGPCSVLEMMIALAIRCEDDYMDDARVGNRTKQWFWKMISSLGLGSMLDERYDKLYVMDVVERFLDREYDPDGRGGLFTIDDCDCDLRDVEIWTQLCWYLDSII